jgi:hypothetical protein
MARVADRPTSAFVASLAGGVLTLIVESIMIQSWFEMYSTNGTNFGHSQWLVVAIINLSAIGGLTILLIGGACGIAITVGGVMQYSGRRSKVRTGSILVLVGTTIGIPATSFGWLLGGLFSTLGAYLGLRWKPKAAP